MSAVTSQMVVDHYSTLARDNNNKYADHVRTVAESFGYAPEDLAAVPEGANLGVSCGNPLAIAALKTGEIVIDLGCGAGFDIFQAARKIGSTGLAIGIDMSQDMLSKAQNNAAKSSITNVKFIHSPITRIPLNSESVDCVISNCVVNLLSQEDKLVCFREMFRLLKRGGRLALSDILAKKEFPEEMRRNMGLFVSCISGASLVSEYEGWLKDVGFEDTLIVDKKSDLNIYKQRSEIEEQTSCCAPKAAAPSCCSAATLSVTRTEIDLADIDFNEWASSYSIYATKPAF